MMGTSQYVVEFNLFSVACTHHRYDSTVALPAHFWPHTGSSALWAVRKIQNQHFVIYYNKNYVAI